MVSLNEVLRKVHRAAERDDRNLDPTRRERVLDDFITVLLKTRV